MLAPAVAAIRARIEANYTATPIRWQNELWGDANPQNDGSPFIEVEVIGGNDELRAFSTPGNNLSIHSGLVRFYIFVPINTGMTAGYATADALAAFMKRQEFGQGAGVMVRTLDFSVNSGVASSEDGNFAVIMCSNQFDWYYQS